MNKWLVPCNINNFDIIEHLKTSTVVYFKKNRFLRVGDIAYIYIAKPYSEIRFRGVVTQENANYEDVYNQNVLNDLNKTYACIEIDKSFSEGELPYYALKEHGLGQVTNQQLIKGILEKYICE